MEELVALSDSSVKFQEASSRAKIEYEPYIGGS